MNEYFLDLAGLFLLLSSREHFLALHTAHTPLMAYPCVVPRNNTIWTGMDKQPCMAATISHATKNQDGILKGDWILFSTLEISPQASVNSLDINKGCKAITEYILLAPELPYLKLEFLFCFLNSPQNGRRLGRFGPIGRPRRRRVDSYNSYLVNLCFH